MHCIIFFIRLYSVQFKLLITLCRVDLEKLVLYVINKYFQFESLRMPMFC